MKRPSGLTAQTGKCTESCPFALRVVMKSEVLTRNIIGVVLGGAVFSETLAEERNIEPTPVERHWRPIPTLTGHGVTHVSITTRRHLIDDVDDDGRPSSRLRVAFQPFEMNSHHVDRLDDCPWCQPGDAA